VLSFAQLRQLRFPSNGNLDALRDRAGRAVLAALGIYAVALQWQAGYQLRSRCQLIPKSPSSWQFIQITAPADSTSDTNEIGVDAARDALNGCVKEARSCGLAWHDAELSLEPSAEFAQLVRDNEEYSPDEAS
jgi:CRISPR-associated protein Csb1